MSKEELQALLAEIKAIEDKTDELHTRVEKIEREGEDLDCAFYLNIASGYLFTARCSIEHELGIE